MSTGYGKRAIFFVGISSKAALSYRMNMTKGIRQHYDHYILPHIIDAAMRIGMAKQERIKLIPKASGIVLEIGAGSGLNFPYYSNAVTKVYALEPNEKLCAKAAPRAAQASFPVEFLGLPGEAVPLDDNSVDTVVCTWVLCSIAGVEQALLEMRRVLKPGGQLLFVEHGRAPEHSHPHIARWQDRITPVWSSCTGGCHLNRRPDRLIVEAGFSIEHMEESFLAGPKIITYHYKGLARSS